MTTANLRNIFGGTSASGVRISSLQPSALVTSLTGATYGITAAITGLNISASSVAMCDISVPAGKTLVLKRVKIVQSGTPTGLQIDIEIDNVTVLQRALSATANNAQFLVGYDDTGPSTASIAPCNSVLSLSCLSRLRIWGYSPGSASSTTLDITYTLEG